MGKGDWREDDRTNDTDVWKNANSYNLQQKKGYKEYTRWLGYVINFLVNDSAEIHSVPTNNRKQKYQVTKNTAIRSVYKI